MTLAEFHSHLDAYGSDLGRWPPALAEEALALMAASEAAQDIFADASALDVALEAMRTNALNK